MPIHSFVICAYKESRYLEKCIGSVLRQKSSFESEIIISTSTPNPFIRSIADKYGLKLFINPISGGICSDWRFGYECASGKYVTLAHQDDVYAMNYAETAVTALEKEKKPLIFFSDYSELRDGCVVTSNRLLFIKRFMLTPLRFHALTGSKAARRLILSFGNPLCCPSVTYAKDMLPDGFMTSPYKTSLDWDIWERLSQLDGAFVYHPKTLMLHRIHAESATTDTIADSTRTNEDYLMFRRFWNPRIASALNGLYCESQSSNKTE